jgi:hypothetical protein
MKQLIRTKFADKAKDYLKLVDDWPKPSLKDSKSILVKVIAVSTNKGDVRAAQGNGN